MIQVSRPVVSKRIIIMKRKITNETATAMIDPGGIPTISASAMPTASSNMEIEKILSEMVPMVPKSKVKIREQIKMTSKPAGN